jgi:hypothetical protein
MMEDQMVGEDKVQIILTVNEWNTILTMLAEQPYKLSAALIQQIGAQAQDGTNQINNGRLATFEPVQQA